MTAADRLLNQAAVEGFDIRLRADGQPVIQSAVGSKPNAAMLAALREHRDEIIRTLGGQPTSLPPTVDLVDEVASEPVVCDGLLISRKKLGPLKVECGALVLCPVDSEWFCPFPSCPQRRRARHQ